MKYLTFLSLVFSSLAIVSAHTWVDNIKVTGGSGPIGGSLGYIRGYVGHSDSASSYRIDKKEQSVYKDNQRQPNQPDPKFKKLQASPGSEITAEWHENGHTTNDTPENNAPGYSSGKIFMYGTISQPNPDLTLDQILEWKASGPLTARYLGSFPYDDGMCAEQGSQGRPRAIPRWAAGGGGPCKGKFNLPEDLKPGQTFTVYWVWDFSGKVPNKNHFEWYSSVMDIDIVPKNGKSPVSRRGNTKEEHHASGSTEDDQDETGEDETGEKDDETSEEENGDDTNSNDDDDDEMPPLIKRSAKFRAAW